ncbi:MAG: DUF1206 domain-containing protein [Rhodococcus sp. (in: high G+C Gram-positive bacteria)]
MVDQGSRAADSVQHSELFERVARAGHVVSGVLHLVIAAIIVGLATGDSGSASQSGALAEVAARPGGTVALWAAVVGFLGLAVWRVLEAAVGKKRDADGGSLLDRAKAGSLAVIYFAFAWSAFQFAIGSGSSDSQQNASMSARMMQSGLGKFALVVVGIVVLAVGGYHIYKGVSRNFLDDLSGQPKAVEYIGIGGYAAKGAALAGAGVLVIAAVFTADPNKASGMDAAIKSLGAQPYGPTLLVIAGVGIGLYGLYAFAMAKWAKM